MKQLTLIFIAIFLTSAAFAQDVKISKRVAYVDDVPFLKWEENFKTREMTVVMSAQQEEPVFSMIWMETRYYNDAAKKYIDQPYINMKFIDFEAEGQFKMVLKKLVKKIYKYGMFDADGNLDQAKAEKFIRTYSENITPPIQLDIRH